MAHEDHPQRAQFSALRMQVEFRGCSDQLGLDGGISLRTCVAINTGEVVVRSICNTDWHSEYVPAKHSTNSAARKEQIETPGSIVISKYTRRLTDGFRFRSPGGTR